MSDKIRDDCFNYWKIEVHGGFRLPCVCPLCNGALLNPANTAWHAEHRIPRAHGGSDKPPNVRPMCKPGHALKTPDDVRRIAKGRRQAKRAFGVKQRKGFRRPAGVVFDWSKGRYVKESEAS